ncbi:pre-mRNA-splicing factor SLT11 [Ephemerocybe angulata]|uniref:Pre-mRNA-splicing factor SLT11 n=1 Tax=Ephemerocybe angulata TaxID=980116 RepID=A0A8H6IGX0_9AGAR|nr:pre-mRNA-splicing factor SLT11 [Tulosesus angulatus]
MPKADINKAGWEQSEFPILCETCLGSNPFVRMSKQEFGRSCGTCARPFTVFRWNPGEGARYKTTVICQTCAKVKNVCQTCLLDLEYGLPTQVRDTALGVTSDAPTSDINREYYAQNMESQMEGGKKTGQQLKGTSMAGKEMLKQLARTDPYYKRNRANICSFFLKGDCNRGDDCPYRHERPIAASSSSSDPNAPRLLNSFADSAGLAPPADPTVTSIYLAHLPDSRIAQTLPSLDPQNIKSVVVISKSHIAFANFKDRDSAELAAAAWAPGLEIHGKQVAVKWGRSKAKAAAAAGAS